MSKAMRFFCYAMASLAIIISLFWGNPMQAAFPPTMKDSEKIVEEVWKTVKPLDPNGSTMAVIDYGLLRRLASIALLSRREMQRVERDEDLYIGMLLATGILLMRLLIRTEHSSTINSNKPSH